jgi:hypothetical protein
MHFLPKMRQRDEKYLSELWRGIGTAAEPEVNRMSNAAF